MRGTENRDAFKVFVEGTRGLPFTSNEGFNNANTRFKKALEIDPDYTRAKGWLAYCYVSAARDGWAYDDSHPEREWDKKRLLDEAETLAKEAVARDPTDYDTHWALAYFLLHSGQVGKAVTEFQEALELSRDEFPLNLRAEMADALVLAGDSALAIERVSQARKIPDWHRWVLAWAYYFRARNDPAFYDLALEELRRMFHRPDEEKYVFETDLLAAAIHAQKGADPQARMALTMFLNRKPGWTIKDELERQPFENDDDRRHWEDGLRKAGLPDGAPSARRRVTRRKR